MFIELMPILALCPSNYRKAILMGLVANQNQVFEYLDELREKKLILSALVEKLMISFFMLSSISIIALFALQQFKWHRSIADLRIVFFVLFPVNASVVNFLYYNSQKKVYYIVQHFDNSEQT